ncbi:cold-shock protein [Paenibacillus oenotherae]|uniref:Cold-shock protein n=1 Tax=Paenibacillus oenotherae TaxID=1435645 RepID=A0ABS7D845_9BACL|nr:cold-shock protein [Paenibacillus oenotherae]MBW7476055.1 cold-shock protein [Paenibacillus oenotherae]
MYSRKKSLEEIPEELTAIWSCSNEGCNSWMRDNFAFEAVPTCRQCSSPMVSSTKMLPLLVNTNSNQKALKKGVQI